MQKISELVYSSGVESFNEKLNQYKLPIALSLVGLVLIIGGVFSSGLLNKQKSYPKESRVQNNPSQIKVDVSGAVNKPGVYAVLVGARVEDAVKNAGGFAENANQEYISKSLNLSQKIIDGQKIYIPFAGETSVGAGQGGVIAGTQVSKIGLNSASQKHLEDLPGVGAATALKIIATRPFATVEELLTKKVVSRSVFEKIKDLVDLN